LIKEVNRFIVLNVMDVGHNVAGNLKKIRIVMRVMKKKSKKKSKTRRFQIPNQRNRH
jgi:hypothetical protein